MYPLFFRTQSFFFMVNFLGGGITWHGNNIVSWGPPVFGVTSGSIKNSRETYDDSSRQETLDAT